MHRHHVAGCGFACRLFDRGDEIGQLHAVRVADVHHAPRGHRRQAIALGYFVQTFGNCVNQQADAFNEVGHIGEVTLHIAVVINVDRITVQDRLCEFEQCHIGASPRAVDGKETEHRNGQVVEVSIGMCHRLCRLFRGSVEGHLVVRFDGFLIRHHRVRTIGRGGRSQQHMRGWIGAGGL